MRHVYTSRGRQLSSTSAIDGTCSWGASVVKDGGYLRISQLVAVVSFAESSYLHPVHLDVNSSPFCDLGSLLRGGWLFDQHMLVHLGFRLLSYESNHFSVKPAI